MTTRFRRILVPHDFSEGATYALRVAGELADRHGARLTVLHVLTPFYTGPGYPTQDEIAWPPPAEIARDREARLAAVVRKTLGVAAAKKVACRAVVGEAVPAILAAAAGADLVVMSTLGRTGLAHLLIGSVAERIVRHAPVPVLTVRAPGAAGKGRRRDRR